MIRGWALAILACSTVRLLAQSTCNVALWSPNAGNAMGLTCSENVSNCESAVTSAAGMWNDCGESGTGFPEIVANGTGDINITVEIRDMNSTLSQGGCAFLDPVLDGNRLTGRLR